MITSQKVNSIRKTARNAGFLYLLMAVLGAFGILYGPSTLIVHGDVAATANNIMNSSSVFRLGIVSALITQTVQVLLVLLLYKLLKPVNRNLAMLMVIFVLLGVPIAMLNELGHFATLLILNGADYMAVFSVDQLWALASLSLDLHAHGLKIAHIFWGLWLFPMGYLIFKSGYMPRILGVLLMVGCAGYLIDFVSFSVFPNFDATISQFTFIGELLLPFWLIFKGVNVEQWEKRALEAA